LPAFSRASTVASDHAIGQVVGGPSCTSELAEWLSERPGREADAEAAYREPAAAGAPCVLDELAEWLGGRPGRQAEANQILRLGLDEHGHTIDATPE
jgi:hypothetical protein